jgi:hypothetical protein
VTVPDREALYRFGPHPHGGWLLGFRLPQVAGFFVFGLIGIALLKVGGFGSLLLVAADLAVAALLLVVRFQGHTVEEWAPLAIRYAAARSNGRHRFRSPLPVLGHTLRLPDGPGLEPQLPLAGVALPAELADLELLEGALARYGDAPMGAVTDRRARTYTATLVCQSSAFYLLSGGDREHRLAAYGGLLAALARDSSPTRRIAWYERTLPSGGDQLVDYLHEARRADIDMAAPPVELVSYLELLDQQGRGSEDHEVLVSLQIDATRPAAAHAIRRNGGGDPAALTVLAGEIALLAEQLIGAGVHVRGVLNRRGLASAIRNGYDPFGRHRRDRGQHDTNAGGIGAHGAGPLLRDTHWGHIAADSSLHTTLWIAEWPRIDVRATFLQELLMATHATRTVGLVMELLGPSSAIRRAERAATEAAAERHLRHRIGKRTSARDGQREGAVNSRERELASGHAAVRFAGYITLSVPTDTPAPLEDLHATVSRAEMAANRASLRLERMWGQQDEALTFTLPLCRGLA